MEFRLPEGFRVISRPRAVPRPPLDGLAELRAYWEGLRRDGDVPARTDLDPRGMSGALERLFIAERVGTGIARVRIAGSALCEMGGLDLRGLPLSCLFLPGARPRLASLLEQVFRAPLAAELLLEAERGIGRPALTARLLMLPLRDVDGSPSLMLGYLAFAGGIGRVPRRFMIQRATEERLVLPAGAPVAAPPAQGTKTPAGGIQRAHLRLVHSRP